MGLKIRHIGNFNKTKKFMKRMSEEDFLYYLKRYAQEGADALSAATPVKTGLTAASWGFEIFHDKHTSKVVWTNDNMNESGYPIVLLIQYGHATPEGSYIEGYDIINPAIRPIFDKMVENVWKEVTKE